MLLFMSTGPKHNTELHVVPLCKVVPLCHVSCCTFLEVPRSRRELWGMRLPLGGRRRLELELKGIAWIQTICLRLRPNVAAVSCK